MGHRLDFTGAGSPFIIVGQAQKTGNTLNPNSGEVTNPRQSDHEVHGAGNSNRLLRDLHIPTTSTSVTRAADVVTIGGAALTALKGAAGSLVAEVQSISAGGSASNRIIGFDTVSQTPLFMFDNNTVGTYNGSIGVTAVLGLVWRVVKTKPVAQWLGAHRVGRLWQTAARYKPMGT